MHPGRETVSNETQDEALQFKRGSYLTIVAILIRLHKQV